jgi:Tfp pilus assembly pilus retraction ATPase PilT
MNSNQGMITMDMSLASLLRQGKINRDEALFYAVNPDALQRYL